MRTVTCHTPGCGNEGIPLEISCDWYVEEDDLWVTVSAVVCGVCEQPIVDVVPPLSEPLPRDEVES